MQNSQNNATKLLSFHLNKHSLYEITFKSVAVVVVVARFYLLDGMETKYTTFIPCCANIIVYQNAAQTIKSDRLLVSIVLN